MLSLTAVCALLQKQLSENVFIDERRPVLLCDGKLSLRVLQDLFNLAVVEMMYGTCRKPPPPPPRVVVSWLSVFS